MKKLFYMAVAAIAALSSCTSDNDLELNKNTGKEALTFTATMEDSEATRATYDNTNLCAAWEVGDQISINGKIYSAQAAGTTSTFKADDEGATGGTYNAYFPASLYDGTTATLPAIQTYTAGKFNMPMYAYSTSTTLAFKNLCAVLAIKVTSDDIPTLKSIKVASDKVMSGKFTVDENNAAVMGTDGTKAVVLESATALTLDETGTTFYIAIPAQEYAYLNIFLSADGETYTQAMATKKAAGLGTIARNTIFNIDYAKNATKLWKGNLFFADCNIGATSPEAYGGYYMWADNIASTQWGSAWRMATKSELEGLLNNCTYAKTTQNSVNGYKFIGKDAYSSNSIFLPAAGYIGNKGSEDYSGVSEICRYWSSTNEEEEEGTFGLLPEYETVNGGENPYYSYSVRAVLEEEESPAPAITKSSLVGTIGMLDGHEGIVVELNGKKVAVATMNVGATTVNGDKYCLGDKLPYATSYEGWSGWRLPTVDELETLCDVHYPAWGDLGGGNGGGALMWVFDGNWDLYLPLDECDGSNPYGKYWTGTLDENDTEKCFYFAPELDYESGSCYDYTPVAYGDRDGLPYKEAVDKTDTNNKFLVRLFHNLQ